MNVGEIDLHDNLEIIEYGSPLADLHVPVSHLAFFSQAVLVTTSRRVHLEPRLRQAQAGLSTSKGFCTSVLLFRATRFASVMSLSPQQCCRIFLAAIVTGRSLRTMARREKSSQLRVNVLCRHHLHLPRTLPPPTEGKVPRSCHIREKVVRYNCR